MATDLVGDQSSRRSQLYISSSSIVFQKCIHSDTSIGFQYPTNPLNNPSQTPGKLLGVSSEFLLSAPVDISWGLSEVDPVAYLLPLKIIFTYLLFSSWQSL